jgi:hypothetical protein
VESAIDHTTLCSSFWFLNLVDRRRHLRHFTARYWQTPCSAFCQPYSIAQRCRRPIPKPSTPRGQIRASFGNQNESCCETCETLALHENNNSAAIWSFVGTFGYIDRTGTSLKLQRQYETGYYGGKLNNRNNLLSILHLLRISEIEARLYINIVVSMAC